MKTTGFTIQRTATFVALAAFLCAASPAPNAPELNDAEIAHVAVTANQIDVDYAAIAQEKSKNKEVLQFAATMAKDHIGVIEQATKLVTKLKVTPADNAMSRSLMEGATTTKKMLNGLSGAAFDKAYIDNEVSYHEAVVGAVRDVLIPQAKNAELKSLLESVLPVLETHLDHAKMVQKEFAKK